MLDSIFFNLQFVNRPIVCDNYIIQSHEHFCYLINGCKSKKKFEKTSFVKNIDKSKKCFLRGQRNVRYHERILSNKKKSNKIK